MCRCVNKYPPLSLFSGERTGSASSAVTGVSVREVGRLGSPKKEVKGHRAAGLVKMHFSLLQGYYVMALGIS